MCASAKKCRAIEDSARRGACCPPSVRRPLVSTSAVYYHRTVFEPPSRPESSLTSGWSGTCWAWMTRRSRPSAGCEPSWQATPPSTGLRSRRCRIDRRTTRYGKRILIFCPYLTATEMGSIGESVARWSLKRRMFSYLVSTFPKPPRCLIQLRGRKRSPFGNRKIVEVGRIIFLGGEKPSEAARN